MPGHLGTLFECHHGHGHMLAWRRPSRRASSVQQEHGCCVVLAEVMVVVVVLAAAAGSCANERWHPPSIARQGPHNHAECIAAPQNPGPLKP